MSSSLVLPSISVQKVAFNSPESLRSSSSSSFAGFKHGIRSISPQNLHKSRVSMSVSIGSRTAVDDALFSDYKPTSAFLFPGQCAQAVGMGQEAQILPAAANLYKKANDILGFDLLNACINGPKGKLDSTILSQVALSR